MVFNLLPRITPAADYDPDRRVRAEFLRRTRCGENQADYRRHPGRSGREAAGRGPRAGTRTGRWSPSSATPEAVAEAAFQAIAKAAQVIDMSRHHGAHPRHGRHRRLPVRARRGRDAGGLRGRLPAASAGAWATSWGFPSISTRPRPRRPSGGTWPTSARASTRAWPRSSTTRAGSPIAARRGSIPTAGATVHRRPRVPHRLQHHAQHPRQGRRHGHRLRAAREGPGRPGARPPRPITPAARSSSTGRATFPAAIATSSARRFDETERHCRDGARLRAARAGRRDDRRFRQRRRPEGPPRGQVPVLQGHRLVRRSVQAGADLDQPDELTASRRRTWCWKRPAGWPPSAGWSSPAAKSSA